MAPLQSFWMRAKPKDRFRERTSSPMLGTVATQPSRFFRSAPLPPMRARRSTISSGERAAVSFGSATAASSSPGPSKRRHRSKKSKGKGKGKAKHGGGDDDDITARRHRQPAEDGVQSSPPQALDRQRSLPHLQVHRIDGGGGAKRRRRRGLSTSNEAVAVVPPASAPSPKPRSSVPVAQWSVDDVEGWLRDDAVDLPHLCATFSLHRIDGAALLELDRDDLAAMHVLAIGSQKRLLRELSVLRSSSTSLSLPVASSTASSASDTSSVSSSSSLSDVRDGYNMSSSSSSSAASFASPRSMADTAAAIDALAHAAPTNARVAALSRNYLCDWNGRFQNTVRRIAELSGAQTSLTDTNLIDAEMDLINLTMDFTHSARQFGRIIISEIGSKHKTIRPVQLGGTLGGIKFFAANIVFKFAVDHRNLFDGDGDEAAAKVAGHDLRGLQCYFNCHLADLALPLMALIDYRGFRLVAMAALPIDGKTIVYGSPDAGKSLHKSNDAQLRTQLRRACSILNLQPHGAAAVDESGGGGRDDDPGVQLAPTDLEVHLGYDSRLYCIDFSRVMPPQSPDGSKNAHLFKLLRPEFVKRYSGGKDGKQRLVSDAYSRFIRNRREQRMAKRAVDDATQQLREALVPACARSLPDRVTTLDAMRLTEQVHSYGINIRFLMLVLRELAALVDCVDQVGGEADVNERREQICDTMALVVIEMVARAFACHVRRLLRAKMKSLGVALEEPYRRLIVTYLNLLFGCAEQSRQFHAEMCVIVEQKFEGGGGGDDAEPPLRHLYANLDSIDELISPSNGSQRGRTMLFRRIESALGLKMSSDFQRELSVNPSRLYNQGRPFSQLDLDEVGERLKTLTIINHAHGYVMLMRGLSRQAHDPTSALRCFMTALSKFNEVLDSTHNDKVVLRDCARALELVDRQSELLQMDASVSAADATLMRHSSEPFSRMSSPTLLRNASSPFGTGSDDDGDDDDQVSRSHSTPPSIDSSPSTATPSSSPSPSPPPSLMSGGAGGESASFLRPRIRRATKYYLRAIDVDPLDAQTHLMYATFLMRHAQFSGAEEHFLRALTIDPSYNDALIEYARYLKHAGEDDVAEEFIVRARAHGARSAAATASVVADRHLRLSDDQ
jgi:tetratricopeptide (TPR) repeat protein